MPNPKRKFSNARRDKRRATWRNSIAVPTLVKCNNPACDAVHMSHHVCPTCGTYNGRQVVDLRRRQASEA